MLNFPFMNALIYKATQFFGFYIRAIDMAESAYMFPPSLFIIELSFFFVLKPKHLWMFSYATPWHFYLLTTKNLSFTLLVASMDFPPCSFGPTLEICIPMSSCTHHLMKHLEMLASLWNSGLFLFLISNSVQ